MKRARLASGGAVGRDCPAWMMTFGDCMSLLVTFFVMLIAFSNLEEQKLSEMIGAMRGAFGAVDRIGVAETAPGPEADIYTLMEGEAQELRLLTIEEIADRLPRFIEDISEGELTRPDMLPDHILVRMLEEGMTVVVHTTALFREGTAEWITADQRLWEGIARLLEGRENEIRITSVLDYGAPVLADDIRSVWSLGIERADRVAEVLQTTMAAAPARFGIGVHVLQAEARDTPPDAVEILILGRDDVIDLQAEEGPWPTGVWR